VTSRDIVCLDVKSLIQVDIVAHSYEGNSYRKLMHTNNFTG